MGDVRTQPQAAAPRGSGTAAPGPGDGGMAEGLLTELKRAAAALRDAGVGYALAGGFAAYARGAAVSTHDVDFVVRPGDVLVVNTTRVLPARLRLRKPTGGAVEVFLLERHLDGHWDALVRPDWATWTGCWPP